MENEDLVNATMEERNLMRFYHFFCLTASIQGRLAYFLMSFHAVNPDIFHSICNYDPAPILFANMLYGIGVMIYWRPNMNGLGKFHRITFSILGSLMFNHSSLLVWSWLGRLCGDDRPYLVTFLGLLSGRIMMIHLLGFLYHLDRSRGIRRSSEFEGMYR